MCNKNPKIWHNRSMSGTAERLIMGFTDSDTLIDLEAVGEIVFF